MARLSCACVPIVVLVLLALAGPLLASQALADEDSGFRVTITVRRARTATPRPVAPASATTPQPSVASPAVTPIPAAPPPTSTPVRSSGAVARGDASLNHPTPTPTPSPTRRPASAPQPPKSVFVAPAAPLPPTPAPPSVAPAEAVADTPRLASAFEALATAMSARFGQPIADEQPTQVDDCDIQQLLTNGLAYWSCSTGAPSFVAADGSHHWSLVNGELVEWTGPSVDPPVGASLTDLPIAPTLICLGPNHAPPDACLIDPGTTTVGVIDSPAGNSVYQFDVNGSATRVHLDLMNLPADYDLYLTDPAGNVLSASMQEDTVPEAIDAVLSPGPYFVYVHSDPGRAYDPDHSFELHLDAVALSSTDDSPS